MKKTILITLLLAMTLGLNAQNASQARSILDKTAAVVGNRGGATANFSMSGKYGDATGTISIKGNKFYANTAQATVWYDGKNQWAYNKSTDEVNISTPTEAQQQSMNPYKFINIYKSGYTLSTATENGRYKVHMVAENQKRTLKELYILITKSYQPIQVKMRSDKGWTTINISNFKQKNLPDATFRFNQQAYPNAEVIDLR